MENAEQSLMKIRLETVLKIYETAKKDPENSAEFNAIMSLMETDAREKIAKIGMSDD
jgi:hypothetical protein